MNVIPWIIINYLNSILCLSITSVYSKILKNISREYNGEGGLVKLNQPHLLHIFIKLIFVKYVDLSNHKKKIYDLILYICSLTLNLNLGGWGWNSNCEVGPQAGLEENRGPPGSPGRGDGFR